jgi:pimeloyl-ACP methyl ester carboxylesterase
VSDHLRIKSGDLDLTVEVFGQGKPIVYAHGLLGNRHASRNALAPLANDYRIVIYDQRGHCDSTPLTEASRYEASQMAGDMAAVMDALGIERAIVGGESMGAATALTFALANPQRIDALLLTAPAFGDRPNPDGQRIKDIGQAMRAMGMDAFLQAAAVRQREQLGWTPDVIAYVASQFGSHDTASIATAAQTVPDWIVFDDLSPLAQLTCPVFIIAWDGDPLHPFDLAQRMAAALPNARLAEMPGLPAIFVDPGSVGRRYREFLRDANITGS